MAVRGRPPLPRGVLAFDDPEWEPPEAVVLDTNVVADALLPKEPEHPPCLALLERLADSGTTVVFSRLLEIELWEVVFNLALRERHPRKDTRRIRYDNRVRPRAARLLQQAHKAWEEDLRNPLGWTRIEMHEVAEDVPKLMQEYGLQSYDAVHAATLLDSELTDFITRDGGFAVLPPAVATLHTTQARLAGTRARRRRAGH
jgi:predicted nucleic acid-binding protein